MGVYGLKFGTVKTQLLAIKPLPSTTSTSHPCHQLSLLSTQPVVEWCPPVVPTFLCKATVVVGRSARGGRGLHRGLTTSVMLLCYRIPHRWDGSRRKQPPPSWQEGDAVPAASASTCSTEPCSPAAPSRGGKHHRASARARALGAQQALPLSQATVWCLCLALPSGASQLC